MPSQDGATHLLNVWSITANEPRIFNLAHIELLEDVEDAPPRQPVPKNPRATSSAFGIDSDHPGVAVIHMRGQVARWQATRAADWARESQELREAAYALGDRKLSYRYEHDHWPTVRRRLLQAGVRLAGVLERALAGR